MSKVNFSCIFRIAILIMATAAGVALTPNDLAAQANRKVGGAGRSTNRTTTVFTDYHLDLGGHLPITITNAMLNCTIPGTVMGSGTTNVSIDWDELSVGLNQSVTFRWSGTQQEANITKQVGRFTPAASPSDVPTLGWDVTAGGDVFLLNDMGSDIAFSNLLFQFPQDFTAESLLALADGPPVGMPGFLTSGVVPAGDRLLVATFPINSGEFLTASHDSAFVDMTFSPNTYRGAFGHEGIIIPEPSPFILLGLGMLGYAWQRKRAGLAVDAA